MMCIHRYYR